MWNLIIKINRKLVITIPMVMAAGFFFGLFIDPAMLRVLKRLIIPLSFLMVYPMMVTLNIRHLLRGMINIRLQLLTQLVNFAIIPFLAYGLGLYFFKEQPYMALGLLLASLLPTSGMTISWTGLARGNMGAAVNMTVIGLTLGSTAAPFYLHHLIGAKIDMNTALIIRQFLHIVFIPMLVGYLTRTILIKKYSQPVFTKEISPRFPALSTLGVLGIVFAAMALKSRAIAANPAILVSILVPIVIFYAFNFCLSTILGRIFFTRSDSIALVYGTVMRNLSIALAVSINAFGSEGTNAALVIAISYIIQVQSAAWYVKLTNVLFGPPPEREE